MIIHLAFRNLLRNKRRTMTILLTLMMGTGALFLYHGFNNGIMNQYRENTIRSRYGNGHITTSGYGERVYEKPWEHWIENWTEIESFLKEDKRVQYVFPRLSFFALLTNGAITVSGAGQGIIPERENEFFTALNVDIGTMLDETSDGAIVGIGLARSLDLKVGDRLTILANTIYGSLNGIDVTVKGIFHTGAKEFDDRVFRIPLRLAQTLLDTTMVETVALGLDRVDSFDDVYKRFKERYTKFDLTRFEILDKIYYQNSIDFLKSQFAFIRLIILVIVVLGIFNTVLIAVYERKQEIGNLRANGESKGSVMRLLITEGALYGIIGSLLGIIIAYLICATVIRNGMPMPPGPGITRQFMVKVELDSLYAINTVFLGILTTLIGTTLAGLRVVKRPIAELLRSI